MQQISRLFQQKTKLSMKYPNQPKATLMVVGLLLITIKACSTRIVIVPYEEFEVCVKPEERAPNFDYSEMEIIAQSDTNVVMNGSWNFVEEVRGPWELTMFSEKYERGQWNIQAFNRKIPDFCKVIQSRFEPWYHVTKHFEPKQCPFPAGTKFMFDMQSLSDFPTVFPPSFAGKWRMTMISVFEIASGKRECFRIYGDLVEA